MLRIGTNDESIEIMDRKPPLARGLLILISFVPLLAPYELLVRPNWEIYLNPFFFFAAIISMGAIAVSVLLLWSAVAGLNSHLRLDRPEGTLMYSVDAPLIPLRADTYPLSSILSFGIGRRDWSDGWPSYSLQLTMEDGKVFRIGSSWTREGTESLRECVQRILNNE